MENTRYFPYISRSIGDYNSSDYWSNQLLQGKGENATIHDASTCWCSSVYYC